jgi:uncharacterized protein
LNPIRFGAVSRQLFGLYQEPLAHAVRGESILLCNPFGQEAIRSHRLFKVLADRLCRDGFHVLRFDYFGTGDSAGSDDEVSIAGFVADLLLADEELLRRSGCTDRSWIGLRLGATVAALASVNTAVAPQRMVLWEPVVNGAAYLAELEHAHDVALEDAYGSRCATDAELKRHFARESGNEVLGFPLTQTLRQELNSLSLDSFAASTALRIDIFVNGTVPMVAGNEPQMNLERQFQLRGIETHSKLIANQIIWTADEMMNASTVPGEVLQRVAGCFTDNSAQQVSATPL